MRDRTQKKGSGLYLLRKANKYYRLEKRAKSATKK